MKNSKRVLGVVLALIMIFNVLAVGTFAAYEGNAAAKLLITTDKATYAPGEEVVISFGVHSNEDAGNFSASGQWAYGYNSSVLEFCSSNYNLGTYGAEHGFTLDASQTGFVGAMSQIVPSISGDDIASGYGWDTVAGVCIGGTECFVDTISDEFMFFTLKMKIKADAADGTYTIGFNAPCYETWWAYNSTDVYGDGGYGDNGSGTDYDFGTATFTVSSAPADPTVEAKGTMARMDDWTKAESTNIFDGGLIGQINNVTLTFTKDADGRMQCNEIESIEVYANGKKMGNAYQVYKVNDTTYQFRAVILNMDKTADTYADDVEYEFRVTMKGDYADYGTLTATKTVSAEKIFTDAYTNYKNA